MHQKFVSGPCAVTISAAITIPISTGPLIVYLDLDMTIRTTLAGAAILYV